MTNTKHLYGLQHHSQNSNQTTKKQQQLYFIFLVSIGYMFKNYEIFIEDIKLHYLQLW